MKLDKSPHFFKAIYLGSRCSYVCTYDLHLATNVLIFCDMEIIALRFTRFVKFLQQLIRLDIITHSQNRWGQMLKIQLAYWMVIAIPGCLMGRIARLTHCHVKIRHCSLVSSRIFSESNCQLNWPFEMYSNCHQEVNKKLDKLWTKKMKQKVQKSVCILKVISLRDRSKSSQMLSWHLAKSPGSKVDVKKVLNGVR